MLQGGDFTRGNVRHPPTTRRVRYKADDQ
jgi:peptidylprolyl isomerase